MKSKKLAIALTLTLTLILGVSGTVFALEPIINNIPNTTTNTHQGLGMGIGRITGARGYDYVTAVLKDKAGLTETEITDGLKSGRTVYDLAKAKGITEEQFKAALLEERYKAVDEAVTKGTITKEEGATLKENLKTNQESCTGNFGQGNSNSNKSCTAGGSSGGKMGSGKGMRGLSK